MIGVIGTVVLVLVFVAMYMGVSRERDSQRYLAEKYRQGKKRRRRR